MSRVGAKPIELPAKVDVKIESDSISINGPRGEATSPVSPGIVAKVDDGVLTFERQNEERTTRAFHGLTRALAANAISGVSTGFERKLEIIGVGYRASTQGRDLKMNLGYSHEVVFAMPKGVDIKVDDNTKITITGNDKQAVGQTAANVRALRAPDAYKGKGIRYAGEIIRLKAGKSGIK